MSGGGGGGGEDGVQSTAIFLLSHRSYNPRFSGARSSCHSNVILGGQHLSAGMASVCQNGVALGQPLVPAFFSRV